MDTEPNSRESWLYLSSVSPLATIGTISRTLNDRNSEKKFSLPSLDYTEKSSHYAIFGPQNLTHGPLGVPRRRQVWRRRWAQRPKALDTGAHSLHPAMSMQGFLSTKHTVNLSDLLRPMNTKPVCEILFLVSETCELKFLVLPQ